MDITFSQLVVAASLAAISVILAVVGFHYTPYVQLKSDDYEGIYGQSELVNFAQMHQEELRLAQKNRLFECGNILRASAIDCDACAFIVNSVRHLIKKGLEEDQIARFSTLACILLKIEDVKVCTGIVKEFKTEFYEVMSKSTLKSKEICSYVLAIDCGEVQMWNVSFPDVPKPPVVEPSLPKPGQPTMRVLHLTDIHIDTEYTVANNAECGEPLCCRKENGPSDSEEKGAGKYGDYRHCDTAPITVDSLFQHLKSVQSEFDYVIFTGDIPPHNVWDQSKQDQISAMDEFTSYVKKYLPNKNVFNTLGNHESVPVNSFPPPFVTDKNSAEWLYDATAQNWLNWLPVETESTIKKAGYYVTQPFTGLRIISLNMNMCNNGNWWLYINPIDPAEMLQWFISQLQEAEDAGDKVHVIGHIFPGCSCCLKPWSWNYYKIVNRYENTIVEQFFGHTHSMYYQMFYDEETSLRPLGVAYMPGSITTYSNLNPGFRIYEIDGNYKGSSWRVLDYTNYYLNLTHANMFGEVVWQKEYTAKEAYKMTSLFPKDWNDLIYRMKTDDSLFETFCRHKSKSGPNSCSACDDDCKKSLLCQLKSGRNGDPDICKDL